MGLFGKSSYERQCEEFERQQAEAKRQLEQVHSQQMEFERQQADARRQSEITDAQQAEFDRHTTEANRQLQESADLLKLQLRNAMRFEELMQRLEELALRADALLSKWKSLD